MLEIILNIYLIINNGYVVAFRAKGYEMEGGDNNKIEFLKRHAREDFDSAYHFDAPTNKKGEFMKYNKFSRLEKQGMQFQLFEEIFQNFKLPENPLVCVTPVVDGKIISEF
ncbi:MAG: hypothetical protein Q8933_06805 [Bacteroidota bacterium]|nr:hypothetical protein [Bacteroidota bacterium]MDP4191955.1 hypothetical protein [Bacteroidota bacterium]MDP4193998.1 hypothetical protein [Bacteroidota bacterium]